VKKARTHISLADLLARNDHQLLAASSDDLQSALSPTLEDLAHCVLFTPGDGRIWMNDQRMILMHASALGAIRRELLETIGHERSRALLTRVGYSSGARDAELIRRQWPDSDLASAFNAGPHLHCLEGVVKVEPVHFEFDVDRGTFFGEFLWHDSSEAAECIATRGIGSSPSCWMQVGYAAGYASAFLGKLIVYRELECMAMGAPHCRIVGKPADQWQDADEDLQMFGVEPKRGRDSGKASRRERPPVAVPATHAGDIGPRALVGLSAAFRAARHMLERVACTDATVLFTGESGVGKELFSRTLHEISPRHAQPFVAVNCAAIPEALIESELFGVERGAFTGATTSRPGRFERASGGTLLLDEVGCLSAVAQTKLLRVLQEGEIERVGGVDTIKVDVRIVAATNVSLRAEAQAGRFRADLFYRLNVFPIELPSLRERRDDIPLLLEHFLAVYAAKHRRRTPGFTRRAVEALLSYDFPGNIRELQNLIERGVICAGDEAVDVVHIFRQGELGRGRTFSVGSTGSLEAQRDAKQQKADVGAGDGPPARATLITSVLNAGLTLQELENQLCHEALRRSDGNVAQAARTLGWTRAQLDYHLGKRNKQS
jgi:two-component system response regulator HydG